MAESRTELLAWLNDILQLRYTKIEQAGTGTIWVLEVRNNMCCIRCCLLPTIRLDIRQVHTRLSQRLLIVEGRRRSSQQSQVRGQA